VLAIFLDTGPAALARRLGEPVAREALLLSLETTLLALLVIVAVGAPAAYGLATRSFRGRSVLVTLVELPLVMPPAVAGIALLATFGPQGLLGGLVEATGARLVFETAGVVVALTFVSAPFFVRQAQSAFEALDPSWLEASRTLGASEAATFVRVAVPSAAPGLLSGMALAWGRALGEFGATLIFAGSFAGVTQTAPLAIYELFATDLPAALALSAVLVAASAGLLLAVKLVAGRRTVPGAWG
jgi:molybdate transport system permease protein